MLVIGLDCATPELVFDLWRTDLPNVNRLMTNGVFGRLKSTIPPITVPAWSSMLSSKDPGQLGFYGFRNRKSYSYDDLYVPNSADVKEKRVWNYLDNHGFRSILIGIPQTFPPSPLKGIMVSSFLAPNKSADYTYPHSVKHELDRIADGNYIIDVDDLRTGEKERLLKQIYLMTERRFKVVRHYIEREPWDFFMFVEMGVDRIHHGFWRYHDASHRLHEPAGPYRDAIRKYYRYVDSEIGKLLQCLDDDTAVMVVSDHGAKRMDGAICINEWLIRKGYLHLKRPVNQPTQLTAEMIDWTKTRVWGEGGYCGRLFFNVQGWEPQGIVPPNGYETFRSSIREELEFIEGENGQRIHNRVFLPDEIYRAAKNIPPDLMVYFEDLNCRAAGTVGHGKVLIHGNDTGPDDANHAEYGIFILKTDPVRLEQAGLKPGQEMAGLSLYDIAPTILDHYGIPVPGDMIGQPVLRRATKPDRQDNKKSQIPTQTGHYSKEEEAIIFERLKNLGYV